MILGPTPDMHQAHVPVVMHQAWYPAWPQCAPGSLIVWAKKAAIFLRSAIVAVKVM